MSWFHSSIEPAKYITSVLQGQLLKELAYKVPSKFELITTTDKLEHQPNAYDPNVVIEFGIMTISKFVHSSKAYSDIVLTLVPITKLIIFEQPEKQ